jgi:hypothetical protein
MPPPPPTPAATPQTLATPPLLGPGAPAPTPGTTARANSLAKILIPTIVGILVLSATGIGLYFLTRPNDTLNQAAAKCGVTTAIADNGKTLSLDTKGKEDLAGDSLTSVTCVLSELDAPTSVIDHISSTRALDGQQTDTWGAVSARWTYHPDAGLEITLTLK